MKSFTILRNVLFAVVMMLCPLTTTAQVPTTMDYQIMATNPKTGMVLANKDLAIAFIMQRDTLKMAFAPKFVLLILLNIFGRFLYIFFVLYF